jgi:hypothetical protein
MPEGYVDMVNAAETGRRTSTGANEKGRRVSPPPLIADFRFVPDQPRSWRSDWAFWVPAEKAWTANCCWV